MAGWVKIPGGIQGRVGSTLNLRPPLRSPQEIPMPEKKSPSPNDQRSNVKNPNNPAHDAARDNRANQLNPNHAPSKGGNGGGKAGSR